MKYYAIIISILLSACTTAVPVTQKFPELPGEFAENCSELKLLEGDAVALSTLMETVSYNYGLYHVCALKHKNMVEWYKKQEKIFNRVGN
jgi:hypothetical protein